MVNSKVIERILYRGAGRSGLNNETSIIAQALSELMEYRAIGLTPTMVKNMVESEKQASHAAIFRGAKLDLYEEIGTVEEFKVLKEKSIPKKPIYSDYDDNGNDEIIPYKATCPVCEYEFEFGYWNDEYNHHCICGQIMNWQQE